MTMYTDPILWNEGQQLLGEQIKIYMNDSTIDWAHIINQALTVEMKDSIHYNQVSGKEMKAYFINGDMRHIEVIGNVLTAFYPEEKDSTMTGFNCRTRQKWEDAIYQAVSGPSDTSFRWIYR